jgi:hypothetical protein
LVGILAGVSGWFLRSLEYFSNFHLSVAYWANANAQMDPRLTPSSSVAEMPRPSMYYQQTLASRHAGLHRQPTTNFNARLQGLQPSHPVQSHAANDQYGLGPQPHSLTTQQVFHGPNLPTGPQQTHQQLNETRTPRSQPTMLKCFKLMGLIVVKTGLHSWLSKPLLHFSTN